MQATYLVTITIDNELEIPGYSGEIQESLESDGFDVIAVKPWARHNIDATQAAAFPETPPTTPLF